MEMNAIETLKIRMTRKWQESERVWNLFSQLFDALCNWCRPRRRKIKLKYIVSSNRTDQRKEKKKNWWKFIGELVEPSQASGRHTACHIENVSVSRTKKPTKIAKLVKIAFDAPTKQLLDFLTFILLSLSLTLSIAFSIFCSPVPVVIIIIDGWWSETFILLPSVCSSATHFSTADAPFLFPTTSTHSGSSKRNLLFPSKQINSISTSNFCSWIQCATKITKNSTISKRFAIDFLFRFFFCSFFVSVSFRASVLSAAFDRA